jgi:hypothetical protein
VFDGLGVASAADKKLNPELLDPEKAADATLS